MGHCCRFSPFPHLSHVYRPGGHRDCKTLLFLVGNHQNDGGGGGGEDDEQTKRG